MSTRQCGSCTLCCKLLPVDEGLAIVAGKPTPTGWHKDANTRCRHQQTGKGCAVYGKPAMPVCCRLWTCVWLSKPEETRDLGRPDRSRYVIDSMVDYINIDGVPGKPSIDVPAIQVWVDPAYPKAHEDPALRAWLDKQTGMVAVIRYNSSVGFVLFPPHMTDGRGWVEHRATNNPEMAEDRYQALVRMGAKAVL